MAVARSLALLVLSGALLVGWATTGADAQVPCLDCDFSFHTVQWNGTARPGDVAVGTFRVSNTGQFADSYTITVTATNGSWFAEPDKDGTGTLPPGRGPFAQSGNSTTFEVRVAVPESAHAGASTAITVTVRSESDPDQPKATTVEAQAQQVYGWTLTCTPEVEVQKTKRTLLELTARNVGNGPDRARITYTPVAGVLVPDLQAIDAAAGESDTQAVDVGVGISAEDGTYHIRWDLRSTIRTDTTATCTTLFTVTGGAPTATPTSDTNDSPAPVLPGLALLVAVGALLRRRVP